MKSLFRQKGRILLMLFFCWASVLYGQEIQVRGLVVDGQTGKPLSGVEATLEGSSWKAESSQEGKFILQGKLPLGEQVLLVTKPGYLPQRFPIVLHAEAALDLEVIILQPDLLEQQQSTAIISLTEEELDEEGGSYDNVSGLLQATKDVFLNTAAFDFGATFFRPRGLNRENGVLLINGVEMNKLYDGRPQWSNWGGLNDVQRNQVFSMGLAPSAVSFGDLAGTTNIIMRASEYSKGGKFSYAISNRSYTGRAMGTYSSGLNRKGWAYAVSLSRRFAEESFREGTVYDANSFFVSVEKRLGKSHSFNVAGFYTPNRRGKTSANTQEVYDLKGIGYNSFWGLQNGEIRNSRMKHIEEPVLMLNHYWKLGRRSSLNTNLAYQFGQVGNSRLDYGGSRLWEGADGQEAFLGGGSNPDPAYYQKLPSYFLREEGNLNYQAAYLAQEEFLSDGQIDWPALYAANLTATAAGGNSLYVLYNDRNDDTQYTANTILRSEINRHLVLNGKVGFRYLQSENFAEVSDLLGGNGFLDVDSFSEGTEAQNNLLTPNRVVGVGEKFKYHFWLAAMVLDGFLQTQFSFKWVDFYLSGMISQSAYQRTGYFQNGNFPEDSYGKSVPLDFLGYGGKAGFTFKMSGRHLLVLNAGYFTKPPNLRNSFSNSRQNNQVVADLKSETTQALDFSYIFRSPLVKARLTGYFSEVLDVTEISFYYADGLSGLGRNASTAFVQEVLSNIQKRHLGGELGVEAQVTETLKLKAAAAVGEFTYKNNPILYLTSDDFTGIMDYGKALLKNYRLAGGPQRAYQVGFEYRDPRYWFFTASANYFSHAYLDVAPITRTQNFFTDVDGLPLNNYDLEIARTLLKQEQFEDYLLVNLVGGKSWKIKQYYIGVFASINNILNQKHKTGGYEQARNANYRTLKEDREREKPVFGPKYWYGYGTTYYTHLYVRF